VLTTLRVLLDPALAALWQHRVLALLLLGSGPRRAQDVSSTGFKRPKVNTANLENKVVAAGPDMLDR